MCQVFDRKCAATPVPTLARRLLRAFPRALPLLFVFAAACSTLRAATPVSVDNYGLGGAPTDTIRAAIFARETTLTAHSIWIVEGGLNNINYYGANMPAVLADYRRDWTAILERGRALGSRVIFVELTPVVGPELDSQIGANAPAVPKIEQLNSLLHQMSNELAFPVIEVYDDFLPHITAAPDAWCFNRAQIGRNDGVHLNVTGAAAYGRALWEGIRPLVDAQHRTVALYGDSIVLCAALNAADRPDAWIERLSNLSAASDWGGYH